MNKKPSKRYYLDGTLFPEAPFECYNAIKQGKNNCEGCIMREHAPRTIWFSHLQNRNIEIIDREEYVNNKHINITQMARKYNIPQYLMTWVLRNKIYKDDEYKPVYMSGREGEHNNKAKLNWDTVKEMRKDYLQGFSVYSIIRKYNVPETTVRYIITNKSWKDDEYQKLFDERKKL